MVVSSVHHQRESAEEQVGFSHQQRQKWHKPRLIAKGFLQNPRLEYGDTYAPVSKLATIRISRVVSVRKDFFSTGEGNVKAAFFHAALKETTYIRAPSGAVALPGRRTNLKSHCMVSSNHRCVQTKSSPDRESSRTKRSTRDTRGDTTGTYIVYVDGTLIAE